MTMHRRKSSPALLDLPFYRTKTNKDERRNSIEAAMLLVNFNQSNTFTNKEKEEDVVPKQTRRYSYDATMSWNTMPESFLDRTDLITSSTASSPSTIEDVYQPRIIWTHDNHFFNSPPRFAPPPQDMLHPLASQPSLHGGMKRDWYYYPPSCLSIHHPPTVKKRRKMDDGSQQVGEHEYPHMSEKDLREAKMSPEARPRKQKLRFSDDLYTPRWVRYHGQAKEGLCDTCQPGKWLQLKNSAYWYHKQFCHGISSVSGKEFAAPVESRWIAQDLVEGLCHQCNLWVLVNNVKRKNNVLWYRHAHKCHLYDKPNKKVIK